MREREGEEDTRKGGIDKGEAENSRGATGGREREGRRREKGRDGGREHGGKGE